MGEDEVQYKGVVNIFLLLFWGADDSPPAPFFLSTLESVTNL
jgi:hypothetical protein